MHRHISMQDTVTKKSPSKLKPVRCTGTMTRRALGMVEEWRRLHKSELLADWALAERRQTLNRIAPLE